MSRLLIAAFAAFLGLASVSAFSKEVQLNDQESAELRQRAERIQQHGMTGRSSSMSTQRGAYDRTVVKAKKAKHHRAKHKARHAKRSIARKTS